MNGDPRPELPSGKDLDDMCRQLAAAVEEHGLSVARDAGAWFCVGIGAYTREVKHSVLHVPDGPVVCEEAARVMAHSTATLMGASLTLAVTGEAGPDTQENVRPGTVWFGVVDHGTAETEKQVFSGDPEAVLGATVEHAIQLLLRHASGRHTPSSRVVN